MPLYRIERRRPVTVFETHFVNADTPEQAQAYIDAGRARAPSEAQEVASTYTHPASATARPTSRI